MVYVWTYGGNISKVLLLKTISVIILRYYLLSHIQTYCVDICTGEAKAMVGKTVGTVN